MKRYISLLVVPLVLMSLSACGESEKTTTDTKVEFGDTEYYKNVEERNSFNYNDERNIDETFSGGMNDDYWYALEGAWHNTEAATPHNGMKNRNLYYTTDSEGESYLAIKGKGIYYKGDDFEYNKPEGGCIISKDHLGPGRYEIEMAALPREGAVTAMWTYCTTTGSEASSQNEIDIELGGTTDGTQFANLWSTTWTKSTVKQTNAIDITSLLHTNDGKIHKYTFDWYTNYPGTGERRVDWFIDGVFMTSITGNAVPEYDTPLWIGVWFPPAWAGSPQFEEDYMLIKDVTYTAFDNKQYYETCRANAGYTKVEPSEVGITNVDYDEVKNVQKISNSHFDSLDIAPRDSSYYGWQEEAVSKGTIELVDGVSDKAFKLTAGSPSDGDIYGEYLDQSLTNAFGGYQYELKFTAKLEDENSKGNLEIQYVNAYGAQQGNTITVPVTSTEWSEYSYDIAIPSGSTSVLKINITAEEGAVTYDEISLIYTGC